MRRTHTSPEEKKPSESRLLTGGIPFAASVLTFLLLSAVVKTGLDKHRQPLFLPMTWEEYAHNVPGVVLASVVAFFFTRYILRTQTVFPITPRYQCQHCGKTFFSKRRERCTCGGKITKIAPPDGQI